jgi:hypothetical protein
MKRKAVIALAVLVPVSVIIFGIAVILIGTRGMPEVAQGALARYLAFRYLSPAPSIRQERQATRPWLFKPEQSSASYSHSVYYRTTHNYGGTGIKQISLSPSPPASPGIYRGSDGLRALPYPPEEIWCVLLEPREEEAQVVLVALHMDLYKADWVVHELPPAWSAAERGAVLSDLGCAVK